MKGFSNQKEVGNFSFKIGCLDCAKIYIYGTSNETAREGRVKAADGF